jgi:deoxyadenosine/deoxycytidine kinase
MMIAIVGPCGSGKTVLVNGLKQHGYHSRQIAQEHSLVQDMWQVLTNPDILIYLDASYETCTERKALNWKLHEYTEQLRRLSHAREHCDVYLSTDDLSTEQVLKEILVQLQGISS